MRIRCYRCGMSYSLGKEEILFAVEALTESGGNHYDARCPRCRHANRVSLEQLKQAAPAGAQEKPEVKPENSSEEENEEAAEANES